MTTQRRPKKDAAMGVVAGPHEYVPQPERMFRRGETVFAVYELYGVPAELLAAPPGPRVFLMYDNQSLPQPPFRKYDAVSSAERSAVSYVAYLDTSELALGDYKLIVAVPGSGNGIWREFTVVE